MTAKPVVLMNTAPREIGQVFRPASRERLEDLFEVVAFTDDEEVDRLLPEAFAIIGQPDLPRARIERAGKLRALLNVEGNFLPNVDYPACFERGIHVLACGPAYGQAVAEYALGLALDLARGISREDRAFRAGRERYVSASTHDSVLLRHADIGLIGFGNLGRSLRKLLAPFAPTLRVYDPWLPEGTLREHDVVPSGLHETLTNSKILFVLATVTGDSEHLLGPAELDLVPDGARLVLVSRAAVVDYAALFERVAQGRFLAAIDVWPEEPVPREHLARSLDGLVLSAHRAGGIPEAFHEIGELVVDDLSLIARGLPPVRMQAAARELVGRYRNRPVS